MLLVLCSLLCTAIAFRELSLVSIPQVQSARVVVFRRGYDLRCTAHTVRSGRTDSPDREYRVVQCLLHKRQRKRRQCEYNNNVLAILPASIVEFSLCIHSKICNQGISTPFVCFKPAHLSSCDIGWSAIRRPQPGMV
jgi:hypothetical protein